MRKSTLFANLDQKTESSILRGCTLKIGFPKTTSARGSYAATVGVAETTGQISEQTAGAQAPPGQLGIQNNHKNESTWTRAAKTVIIVRRHHEWTEETDTH